MKRNGWFGLALAALAGATLMVVASSDAATTVPAVKSVVVQTGDGYNDVALALAPGASSADLTVFAHYLARANAGTDSTSLTASLQEGRVLWYDPSRIPAVVATTTIAPSTSSSVPPSTASTSAPTTTVTPTSSTSTSTSTAPATSTSTTTSSTTSTSQPGTTTSVPGSPGCGLSAAAFCETFDAPHNGGTQTGDLDPTVWGVSRSGDAAQNYGLVVSHNACANGAATPAPGDAQVCNGQYVESNNDGGLITAIDSYPKQPFNWAGRTGTVVFDVSNNSSGSHGAWPDFLITDEPVPGVIECISECNLGSGGTPTAVNELGFDMSATDESSNVWGITRFWQVKNGVTQGDSIASTDYGTVTKGSPTAMNHVKVTVSDSRIDVYATDAGATTFQHIAGADIPGGLGFSQGLVWINDVHYNATKAIEPCGCGTEIDHSFTWDNVGFDGPKTYRDLGFDVPLANRASTYHSPNGPLETEEGYDVNQTFTVHGVNWQQPYTTAKVVFDTYHNGSENAPLKIVLNGHTADAQSWVPYEWFHGQAHALAFPAGDVVAGDNTISITSTDGTYSVANVSLILVAAAPAL